ncbi:hypothetical protein A3G63_00225 [Candidatus Kaiserbacteria bacterium RIFCSPLOWO2_12_FULL_52_8]|nr:MAG: hypothetical protein A3G63_00225 [Candidatus Kaiserbacteria bacterium RIFCSPLOWO2_12_FULL_52_8]
MNKSYWETKLREKFSFLYPSEHIAADISKGVIIGLLTVVAGLYLIDISISFIGSDQEQTPSSAETGFGDEDIETIATSTAKIRGYDIEFVVVASDFFLSSESLRILRDNEEIFSVNNARVSPMFGPGVSSPEWKSGLEKDATYFLKWAIKDITNNGIPELGLMGYSGGAHCCDTNYIVELSNPIKILWQQYTGDGGAEIKDLNGDGIMEIEVMDDVLDYWNTSHATSPFPNVVFSYQNGTYKVGTAFMRKTPSTRTEVESTATGWTKAGWEGGEENCGGLNKKILSDKRVWCAYVPWEYAADLVYSGNSKAARDFIDLAWKENDLFKSKEVFIGEFMQQLTKGKYYEDLAPFLNLKAL